MRDRKMAGGAICSWCIRHPKDGIPTRVLLAFYWRSTGVLPASYSLPAGVLLESCFDKRPKTRGELDVRTAKKKSRSNSLRCAPATDGEWPNDTRQKNEGTEKWDARSAHGSWLTCTLGFNFPFHAPFLVRCATPTTYGGRPKRRKPPTQNVCRQRLAAMAPMRNTDRKSAKALRVAHLGRASSLLDNRP